jgi:antitoxin component YwqK of YwqJK toxin-antitoxin module
MEDIISCYICYEQENENNCYLKEPQPCECKGSIMIHKNCFKEVLKSSRSCTICKTKYKLQYLPNKNGLELITEEAINGDISEYTINANNAIEGEYIIKKQTGEIISKTNYVDGLMHGEYRTWYENGQLECQCTIINNRIDGIYKTWYDNGIQMEESFYKDGLKDGTLKRWYSDGKQTITRVYKNGEIESETLWK